MVGNPVNFLFGTADPDRTKSFLGALLGWESGAGSARGGFNVADFEPA